MAKRILASPRFEREVRFASLIPAVSVYPELPKTAEKERVVLQGAVDLLFEENGGLVLVDFKTDRLPDAAALWNRYRAQLSLYRGEIERCCGKPVIQCLLYSFHLNCEITGSDLPN